MTAGVVQGRDKPAQTFGPNRQPPPHAHMNGHIDLIKGNMQGLAIPMQAARSDAIVVLTALDMAAATLGHGPSPPRFTVQGHIERTEIIGRRYATAEFSRQCVIG